MANKKILLAFVLNEKLAFTDEMTVSMITSCINTSTLFDIWTESVIIAHNTVSAHCYDFFCQNYQSITDDQLQQVDLTQMQLICSIPQTEISELELFLFVVRWTKLTACADTTSLMKLIAFQLIGSKKLFEVVEPTGLVPKDLIYNAIREQNGIQSNMPQKQSDTNKFYAAPIGTYPGYRPIDETDLKSDLGTKLNNFFQQTGGLIALVPFRALLENCLGAGRKMTDSGRWIRIDLNDYTKGDVVTMHKINTAGGKLNVESLGKEFTYGSYETAIYVRNS